MIIHNKYYSQILFTIKGMITKEGKVNISEEEGGVQVEPRIEMALLL